MAIPIPTRQAPGLEVPVFLDIESRIHGIINRALRVALAEQTKGLVSAGRAGDTRGVQDRINSINFGPAAEGIRGQLEVQAMNAMLLGASQFVEGKRPRDTKFVLDREIPIEVMQAVNGIVTGLDGSQTENVRREVQVVANELEAKLSEGSPDDSRVLKQVTAVGIGGFGVGQLATALNAAVNTGSAVQAGIAANIITTRMMSFGALAQAGVKGIGRYQWNSVLDSNTCKFCRGMNGKTFQVGPALEQIRAIILAGDPETAKALSPWPSQTAANIRRLAKLSNAKLQARGFAVPPAHPSCRCVLSPVGTVPKSQIRGFITQALRARRARKPIADKLLQRPQVVRPGVPREVGLAIPEEAGLVIPEEVIVHSEIPQELQTVSNKLSRRFRGKPKAKQAIDDLDELFVQAEQADPVLKRVTRELADDLGGEAVFAPEVVEGVHVGPLKSRARVIEKAIGKYEGDFSAITDFARASIQFDDLDSVYRALGELERRGVKIVRINDRFAKPLDSGYRDIILGVEMPNGHVAELQLHVRSILAVKEENHLLYEQVRSIMDNAAGRRLTVAELSRVRELNAIQRVSYEGALRQAARGVRQARSAGLSVEEAVRAVQGVRGGIAGGGTPGPEGGL